MPSIAALRRAGQNLVLPSASARIDLESAMESSSGSPPPLAQSPEDRLDSWKEIAAYLKRDVSTVQRWEKREGMPVHRHLHDRLGSVYAFRTDLDAWSQTRQPRHETDEAGGEQTADSHGSQAGD